MHAISAKPTGGPRVNAPMQLPGDHVSIVDTRRRRSVPHVTPSETEGRRSGDYLCTAQFKIYYIHISNTGAEAPAFINATLRKQAFPGIED